MSNDPIRSAFTARSREQAQEQILVWIKECRLGASDCEKGALELAALWQFDQEPITEGFAEAREFRAKQPKSVPMGRIIPASELHRRRLTLELKAEPVKPPVEPPPASEPEPEPVPEAVVALPALVPGFFASSEIARFEPEEVLVLDPSAPFDNAQKLISLKAWHRREGIRTLQYWQRAFWDWNGRCWDEADEETVRAAIWQQLNAAEKFVKGGKTRTVRTENVGRKRNVGCAPWGG